jgi:3-methyl-2-oxobutanoate hydroxymethyltransferase
MTEQVTVPDIRVRKRSRGAQPIVMITAYDAPFARVVDQADVDVILVGDTVAEVVLGWEDTLHIGIGDLAHHLAAVARAKPRALLVGDMPWLTYHLETSDTVRNAAVLVRAGAQAVKLEGGRQRVTAVRAITEAEIPVMGHLGLTPQSVHAMGGYKVQGREAVAASEIRRDAEALVSAGCFAIVLEGVPDALAERITEEIEIPTIGIGAGPACDGQVIVLHDLLGLAGPKVPKFVRRYAELGQAATEAVRDWAADVREGRYPSEAESYRASAELRAALGLPS